MRPSRAELERELARAESQAARLRRRLERTEHVPDLDPYEDGSVLVFTTEAGYTYVALRARGLWYLTGRSTTPYAWSTFVANWLGTAVELHEVTELTEVVW